MRCVPSGTLRVRPNEAVVDKAAQAVLADEGRAIEHLVATIVKLPRAALMAGEIAERGEFFAFGINDLAQTTVGVSLDDAARFLDSYVEKLCRPRCDSGLANMCKAARFGTAGEAKALLLSVS